MRVNEISINNIRYADDTVTKVGNLKDTERVMRRILRSSVKHGLSLKIRTKVIKISNNGNAYDI